MSLDKHNHARELMGTAASLLEGLDYRLTRSHRVSALSRGTYPSTRRACVMSQKRHVLFETP
jgi:hypothetical protein